MNGKATMDAKSAFLLEEVQSGGIESLQQIIFSVAARWMAAGCIDQANRLVSLWYEVGDFLSESSEASDDSWQRGDTPWQQHPPALDSFEIPWALTNTRPARVSAPVPSFEDIELEQWRYLFSPVHAEYFIEKVKNIELDKLSGIERWVRAKVLAYDESRPGHAASPERLAEALALLDRPIDIPDQISCYQALMSRVVLAAKLGDAERARNYLINLAEVHDIIPPFLSDRAVARIALLGVLAPIWKITPQGCDDDARVIEDAWRERRKVGRFVY